MTASTSPVRLDFDDYVLYSDSNRSPASNPTVQKALIK